MFCWVPRTDRLCQINTLGHCEEALLLRICKRGPILFHFDDRSHWLRRHMVPDPGVEGWMDGNRKPGIRRDMLSRLEMSHVD